MRFIGCLIVLVLVPTIPGGALGRLVQPDGTSVALGVAADPEGWSLFLPPRAIRERSWLTLAPGTVVTGVEVVSASNRRVLTFPRVSVPGMRFSFEVSPQILSIRLRGVIGDPSVIVRTLARPASREGSWVTHSFDDLRIDLPPWKTSDGFVSMVQLTRRGGTAGTVVVSGDGRAKTFRIDPSVRVWQFAPQSWGFQPTRFQLLGTNPDLLELGVRAYGPEEDLPADPVTLLAWPGENWRHPQREWYRWEGTQVLVLVSADYEIQDQYLKRLAFYVEKTGFRGRLVSDQEMQAFHGWNAHDYSASALARFFTQAAQEGFPLSRAEQELGERLVAAGVILPEGAKTWVAGEGALIGISLDSGPALRSVLFVHEGYHGLYFTTAAFREGVQRIWESMSEGAREAFRSYLARSRYDPSDEPLMMNEFQAYVLQREAAAWAPFFRDRVLSQEASDLAALSWLAEYLEAARALDRLVQDLFHLSSGSVFLVNPTSE